MTDPPLKAPTGFRNGNAAVGVSNSVLVVRKPRDAPNGVELRAVARNAGNKSLDAMMANL